MHIIKPKTNALQKVHNDCTRLKLLAEYHENSRDFGEAYRCWVDCLNTAQGTLVNSSRSLPPSGSQERILLDEISKIERICFQKKAALAEFKGSPRSLDSTPSKPIPNPMDRINSHTHSEGAPSPASEDGTVRSVSTPVFGTSDSGSPSSPRRPATLLATLRTKHSSRHSPKKKATHHVSTQQSSNVGLAASRAATMAWGSKTETRNPPPPRKPPPPPPYSPAVSERSQGDYMDSKQRESTSTPTARSRDVQTPRTTELNESAELILSFFRSHKRSRACIEFIPVGFRQSEVIVEGNHIGITKEALCKAFMAVRPEFHRLRSRFSELSSQEAVQLMETTTIIILIDREHLTAVNTRKRLLSETLFSSLFPPEEELTWLSTILTSDLHKHVKAPLLWTHRRWLHERILRTKPSVNWVRQELDVVTKAGEVHPKNYYSWDYARWTVNHWLSSYTSILDETTEGIIALVFEELSNTVVNWCYNHVSDTSGFSFLAYVYSTFLKFQHISTADKDDKRALILKQLKAVIEFGENVASGHDSLWVFVRTVLTPGFLEAGDASLTLEHIEQRQALIELLQNWSDKSVQYASNSRPLVPLSRGAASYRKKSRPQKRAKVEQDHFEEKANLEELSASIAKRIEVALKNVGKGVDPQAANQIINEIMVKGDEVHWDDIAGLEGAKNALKEVVVYPFLRPDLFSGLREPARGMLLFGPPGTGKTMLARAVATESRSTFFAVSASSLTSKYHGESEKLVRALFAMAKELAPSIIFVDEIDALLSERSSNEHEASRKIKTEFLIHWSDLARAAAGKQVGTGDPSRVLVLAATNLPWAIDEAARRRFVRRQYIPLPEAETRAKQFQTLLQHQKHAMGEQDISRLLELTEGFSGSDITALAKDAAMGPLRELGDQLLNTKVADIRPIELRDFERSLIAIRPSVSSDGLKRFEEWAEKYGERV